MRLKRVNNPRIGTGVYVRTDLREPRKLFGKCCVRGVSVFIPRPRPPRLKQSLGVHDDDPITWQ